MEPSTRALWSHAFMVRSKQPEILGHAPYTTAGNAARLRVACWFDDWFAIVEPRCRHQEKKVVTVLVTAVLSLTTWTTRCQVRLALFLNHLQFDCISFNFDFNVRLVVHMKLHVQFTWFKLMFKSFIFITQLWNNNRNYCLVKPATSQSEATCL